jgi:hypothetical protein
MSRAPIRSGAGGFLVLLLLLTAAAAADAGTWKGHEERRDGVLYVSNPTEPADGAASVELRELWRLGGESEADEEFFGVISKVATGPEGNVYLLDQQLSEVRIFTSDGAYVRTIGREGEGPGEFRRPTDLFFTPDGNVAVLQMAPGKIVLLTPQGEPAGDFPAAPLREGAMVMLRSGALLGDRVVLLTNGMKRGDASLTRTASLSSFDESGAVVHTYWEDESTLDFADPVIREGTFGLAPWAAARDGALYLASPKGEYSIKRFAPDGSLDRVIERSYQRRKRSDDEKKEMEGRIVVRGRGVAPRIEVMDYDPDIAQIHARDDGTLWIMNSRQRRDREEGSPGSFDVFSADGRYQRTVTLRGEGDPETDAFYFSGDRLYVVRHYADAMRSMFGGGGEEGEEAEQEEQEEAEPIEVIAYQVNGGALSAR